MSHAHRPKAGKGWAVSVGLLAFLAGLPLLAVGWLAITPTEELWAHLFHTVLPNYLYNTVLLGVGVSGGALLLGVPLAWMVSVYEFPGRKLLDRALFLPLAIPTYLIAFVYTDFLEYAGPVQVFLREAYGWRNAQDYWFPSIRTLGGGIIVLTLCLYPYVYWLARAAFFGRGTRQIEAARLMGEGPFGAFRRVGLPLARPALAAGVLIVWMETANDIGAVEHFGIQTLTVGIFDVWLHLGRPGAAAQIALVLLVLIIFLATTERLARGGRRYHTDSTQGEAERRRLSTGAGVLTAALLFLPLLAGFLVPAGRLLYHAANHLDHESTGTFWNLALHSITLSTMAACVSVALALVLAYGVRLYPSPGMRHGVRFATLGYAIPGAVLALGILTLTTTADLRMADVTEWFGGKPTAILGGTIFALVAALCVRFLALAYGTIDAGLQRVTPNMDDAARMLGASPGAALLRVHLPLLKGSWLTAAALVFVDSMKELPMTLLLRPFNYETLASHVYQLASDERLEASALSALAIVVVGIGPVLFLGRLSARD